MKPLREIIPLNEAHSFQQAKDAADRHRDRARSHEVWRDYAKASKLNPAPNAPGSKFPDSHKAKRHRQAVDAATRVMSKKFGLK